MTISAKWMANVKDWISSSTGSRSRWVGRTKPCSWRMWTVTWSVKWYTTLRMSTWTAGVLLPFSCESLARLERPGVTHVITMRSNTMRVMRFMAYHLECLFAKSQVPYTAKMMPHGSREPQQADGAHRRLARSSHVALAPVLTEDGQGALLSS